MVVIHVAADRFYSIPPSSFEWQALNVWDSVARLCVPLFFMISGTLFLDPTREVPLRRLFARNILRIVTAFVFWSGAYALYSSQIFSSGPTTSVLHALFKGFLEGFVHLWFLFAIVGLYLVVPLLRRITADKRATEYFLVLAAIFALIVPLVQILPLPGLGIINSDLSKAGVMMVGGYSVYFVGGHYFAGAKLSKALTRCVYVLGGGSIVITAVLTSCISVSNGTGYTLLYSYLLPTTALSALAVFLLMKSVVGRVSWRPQPARLVRYLAQLSFGLYLVHFFFILFFGRLGVNTGSLNAFIAVPLIATLICISGLLVSAALNRIPVVSRYIV
jgi:surface polysaccharide O-acyltransferase-like enzyme